MSAAEDGAPLLSVDRWLCNSGMRGFVDRLIVDLIASRPCDVLAFIHAWSAPPPFPHQSHHLMSSGSSPEWPSIADLSTHSLLREANPSVDELRRLFTDAAASPFTFLRSELDRAEFLSGRACGMSGSADSLGPRCGRGNFGFVVPAQRIGACAETSRGDVAIKVVRVQALWSLDEPFALQRITAHARELQAKEETHKKEEEEEEEEEEGKEGEGEEGVKMREHHCELVAGSRLVTCLVGDVMYDSSRDALLMPLEFFPCTLADCVSTRTEMQRSKRESYPSCSSLNDACGLAVIQSNGEIVVRALFSPRELQYVARSLCRALFFLHTQCGLCHMDVKAGNILLSSPWPAAEGPEAEGPLPRVVLSDFGLAQPVGAPISQIGDFATMAPEVYWAGAANSAQHAANRIDTFSGTCDVWSLGCVLLHMMDGFTYGAWETGDLFTAMEENYVSPAPRHPHLWPAELIDFVMRCFDREPRRRVSAEELLNHPFMYWNP